MSPLAVHISLPTFSLPVFCSLLSIVGAGGVIFYYHTRRWTTDRRRAAMEDWASEEHFRLRSAPAAELPSSLQSLSSLNARVEMSLIRGPLVLLRITTSIHQPASSKTINWHVLIRELDRAWTPAGLRPFGRENSFLDLFSLTEFPALLPPERFVAYGSDSRAAREMARSSARGLLPPDIGLMVHGPYVTLDFSARPFDTIEFARMLVVMEQVIRQLPATTAVA